MAITHDIFPQEKQQSSFCVSFWLYGRNVEAPRPIVKEAIKNFILIIVIITAYVAFNVVPEGLLGWVIVAAEIVKLITQPNSEPLLLDNVWTSESRSFRGLEA